MINEDNQSKYKIGDKFYTNNRHSTLTIIAISDEQDSDRGWVYFVKNSSYAGKHGRHVSYYDVWDYDLDELELIMQEQTN